MSRGPLVRLVDTVEGPARVTRHAPPGHPVGTLVLGHGAGGGTESVDLQALTGLTGDGWVVALVDQPWRVAGRRVATRPERLDAAWADLLPTVTGAPGSLPRPLVTGGRSAGARVACRNAPATGGDAPRPDGVLCLAFPLRPPRTPARSRAEELRLPLRAGIPVLVVQGDRDPFGTPEQVRAAAEGPLEVVGVPGTHSPTRDLPALLAAVRAWLTGAVLPAGR